MIDAITCHRIDFDSYKSPTPLDTDCIVFPLQEIPYQDAVVKIKPLSCPNVVISMRKRFLLAQGLAASVL